MMVISYNKWYKTLSPARQLIISFIVSWFYWLLVWLISQKFFYEQHQSWTYHLISATLMALFMTLLWKWKQISMFFNSRNKKSALRDDEKLKCKH
jgi:hypothetical protein